MRYYGSQAKIFVPVDFSMDLVTTISPYSEMLDFEIFGRALLEEHILSSAKFHIMALKNMILLISAETKYLGSVL